MLIPEVVAAKEAVRLLAEKPRLWVVATLQERCQLLTMIPNAVYIDMRDRKTIVSVQSKLVFQPVLVETSFIGQGCGSIARAFVTNNDY